MHIAVSRNKLNPICSAKTYFKATFMMKDWQKSDPKAQV